MSDVVITGLGIVSPLGVGGGVVWQAITAGQSGVRPIRRLQDVGWIAPFGSEVLNFEAKEFVTPRKSLKVMAPEIQFAFAAAEQACRMAGLVDNSVAPERFGVVCGAGMLYCDFDELESPFRASINGSGFDMRAWGAEGMRLLFPLWMLKYLPNMSACHVGIHRDARGPTNTIAHGDVSSLMSIGEAADCIRRGHADVMLAGGTGSRLHLTDLLWRRGEGLTLAGDEPAAASRPFELNRQGMVCGEGCAMFVLESVAHAERRKAKPLARIAGFGSRFEPSTASRQPTGLAIENALRFALEQSGESKIAFVKAHGNAMRHSDQIEAQAIHRVLGDTPVTAPTSYFGELGAGGGAVELAVALLGFEHNVIPPTLNYDEPDPYCPVNIVTTPQPIGGDTIVALNHTPTGQAAALVLKKA
jgi:3-oxoacyl-[acyl-carrier-protein] synthase II